MKFSFIDVLFLIAIYKLEINVKGTFKECFDKKNALPLMFIFNYPVVKVKLIMNF